MYLTSVVYDVMIEILLKTVFQIWSTVFADIRKLLNTSHRTGPQVLLSCSTQLNMKILSYR